ncbi:MAG: hypothetical protein WC523_02765 [Patescibacteria group bacterium]
MLTALFGSATRVKTLNLFLLHPEQKYYLHQLARELNLPTNSIRRELDNMIKFNLIIAEKINNSDKENKILKKEKNYFSVNKNFILYPEIRALFIKAQILSSHKFISGLQKISQPRFLVLTGLFTNYPEAQTDLLLVGHVRRTAFLKLIKDLEKDLGREINFTIMDEREFKYRQEIMDIFLYNILEGKIIVLVDNIRKR